MSSPHSSETVAETPLNTKEASPTTSNVLAQFLQLFEQDKNRLYAYIYAYVMDEALADDIFQETSMVLWKDFENFELGTSFSKWANGIAFNRIRGTRRDNKKYLVGLSDDFLQEFNQTITTADSEPNLPPSKWWHLQHCSSLLTGPLKQVYQHFYVDNLKAQEVAEHSGRSIFAIRKSVHKLRKMLFDCVHKNTDGSST